MEQRLPDAPDQADLSKRSPEGQRGRSTATDVADNVGRQRQSQSGRLQQTAHRYLTRPNNPHGLQFWGIAWIADYPDPQDWTTLQFGKGSQYNQINYGQNTTANAAEQQQVQQALAAADVNQDQTTRMQAYNQAEQSLVNDVAWLPMEQVAVSQVLKAYVRGIVFNPQLLIPPNDWGNIFIATH